MKFTHEMIEKNSALLIVLVILVVAVGGLVEIVPLYCVSLLFKPPMAPTRPVTKQHFKLSFPAFKQKLPEYLTKPLGTVWP